MANEQEKDILQELTNREYEHGFTTDIETEFIRRGLDEEVVRTISEKKGEPAVSYTHLTLPTMAVV